MSNRQENRLIRRIAGKGWKWGIAFLVSAALLAGCSASKKDSGSQSESSLKTEGAAANADMKSKEADNKAAAPENATMKNAASPAAAAADKNLGKSVGSGQQQGFTAGQADEAMSRKIIYKANVAMEVKSYADAQTEVQNLITLSNAYILVFSENETSSERSGTFSIKVPASGFSPFLADLTKIGHVKVQRSVQGQDVSEEYVDLTSRLKGKEVEESRLLSFMEKATKTDDLVAFSNQLGKVQTDIETIKGRMRYLDQNVAYSTVDLRLYERLNAAKLKQSEESPTASGRAWNALAGSASFVVGNLENLFVFLAGALPVLLVILIVAVPSVYIHRKTRKRKPAEPKAHYGERIDTSGEKTDAESGSDEEKPNDPR